MFNFLSSCPSVPKPVPYIKINIQDSEWFCVEEWSKIPLQMFDLARHYRKRLSAVILSKGKHHQILSLGWSEYFNQCLSAKTHDKLHNNKLN